MKATTVGFMIVWLIFGIDTARGQFNAIICSFDSVLTDSCFGGSPLPDGTPVLIFWDQNGDGPDETDPQPQVGNCDACCNFNSFLMNGEEILGMPGTFCTDPAFTISSTTPQPSIYYLRVYVCNRGIHWTSSTFTIPNGLSEIFIGGWTCGPCVALPGQVHGLSASQDLCHSIHLRWNHEQWAQVYNIYRDGEYIGWTFDSMYADSVLEFEPACNSYSVRAANEAGEGPMSAPAEGCFISQPPGTVTGMSASTDLCGRVTIRWNLVPNADSYRILRDGNMLAQVPHPFHEYDDVSLINELVHTYTVIAQNSCGSSPVPIPIPGRGRYAVSPVTTLSATSDRDDRISLSWTNVTREDGYEILRTSNTHVPQFEVIATTVADVTVYDDFSVSPGRDYLYRVQGFNAACGVGGPSPVARGLRTVVEPIVFREVIVTTNISGVMSAVAVDLDNDGDMDVVAAGMFADKVAWYENNGSWGFTEHVLVSRWPGARAVDVGDIDSDGDLDIVAVARFANSLVWFEKVEWGYWMQPISSSVMGASDVILQNINQGGEVEIVTSAAIGGDISVWHYNGDAAFTRQIFATNLQGLRSLGAHWIFPSTNGMVVTAAAAETGAIVQWRSFNGYQQQIIGYAPGLIACGATHINAEVDSVNDVYYCTNQGVLGWYERNGQLNIISSLIDSPRDVVAARIDRDNRDDLLLASGSEISWWRNTQNRFYRNVITEYLPQASVVRGIDADFDGDMDVLAAGDNEIRFYLSTLFDTQENATLAKPIPQDDDDHGRAFSLPSKHELFANYPNPFNALTTIRFALPEANQVTLAIYDVTGREAARLVDGTISAGIHSVNFDASALSSGVYFYRLEAGSFVETRKMVLMK